MPHLYICIIDLFESFLCLTHHLMEIWDLVSLRWMSQYLSNLSVIPQPSTKLQGMHKELFLSCVIFDQWRCSMKLRYQI